MGELNLKWIAKDKGEYMTLRELLDLKLVYDNAEIVCDQEEIAKAVKVMNRPVAIEDFNKDITQYLDHKVNAIFGTKDKYKVGIDLIKGDNK